MEKTFGELNTFYIEAQYYLRQNKKNSLSSALRKMIGDAANNKPGNISEALKNYCAAQGEAKNPKELAAVNDQVFEFEPAIAQTLPKDLTRKQLAAFEDFVY
jgi:hypothetical protein